MPAIAAAPAVYAAIAGGVASTAGSVIAAKSQSGATKRSIAATTNAAAKAEAFEREQDAQNRADQARRDAEDERRWSIDQQNLAATKAEQNARQAYEDKLRYRKMVNLAKLTGGPMPDPLPDFGGAGGTYTPAPSTYAAPGAPILAQPSTANAMIAAPGQGPFDPFAPPQPGIPLSAVSRRMRTV